MAPPDPGLAMKRFPSPIFIGILLTLLFLVLEAFGGGICHCEKYSQFFFPYVSMLGVHATWGVLGFLLFGLQFPVYAVSVAMANGPIWKARVLLILIVVHACAVWVAFKISG
jgi:hypothetical protein